MYRERLTYENLKSPKIFSPPPPPPKQHTHHLTRSYTTQHIALYMVWCPSSVPLQDTLHTYFSYLVMYSMPNDENYLYCICAIGGQLGSHGRISGTSSFDITLWRKGRPLLHGILFVAGTSTSQHLTPSLYLSEQLNCLKVCRAASNGISSPPNNWRSVEHATVDGNDCMAWWWLRSQRSSVLRLLHIGAGREKPTEDSPIIYIYIYIYTVRQHHQSYHPKRPPPSFTPSLPPTHRETADLHQPTAYMYGLART